MPKIPPIFLTIIFAVLWAVTAYFLFDLHRSHKALKASVKVLETGLIEEIEVLSEQLGTLETDYNDLQDADTDLKADVEELRITKADAKTKRDEDKDNAASATAESIRSKWAERYGN